MQEDRKSLLYEHAADALCRARKLPVGSSRNDLRQLAVGLRWLDKKGLESKAEAHLKQSEPPGPVDVR
jgi:hypothetical protein